MVFWTSFSASTCTTALGYTPPSLCQRIVGVVGRPDFPGVLYPRGTAWCLMTALTPQEVPVLIRPVRDRACVVIEPEGQDDKRDYTVERALRIPSINSTARGVAPGTVEAVWTGLRRQSASS